MIPIEKAKAAQRKVKKGYPVGEIKNELLQQGYTIQEVNNLFKPHKYDMRSWYLFFAIVFLIAGLYNFIFNEGLIPIGFSVILFYQYYLANKKHHAN